MTKNSQSNHVRTGIIIAVAIAVAVVLYFFFAHPNSTKKTQPSAANAPTGAMQANAATPPDNRETALAPIQLTPQRMQSIGVTFGTVELKDVTDDIRAAGNVEMDERRASYVQIRFPGWIRTVNSVNSSRYQSR